MAGYGVGSNLDINSTLNVCAITMCVNKPLVTLPETISRSIHYFL